MKRMIFKKIAAVFICGTVMAVSFPGLTAFATADPEQGVTGIVTTIPNVETSVPQTTQTPDSYTHMTLPTTRLQ